MIDRIKFRIKWGYKLIILLIKALCLLLASIVMYPVADRTTLPFMLLNLETEVRETENEMNEEKRRLNL